MKKTKTLRNPPLTKGSPRGEAAGRRGGGGFDYYLSKETIKRYEEKPLELRLEWLYQLNLLRKSYPKRIIKLQDKFREGRI